MRGDTDTALIISDIEGSSGCWAHAAAQFKTPEWALACLEMSRDVDAVCRALFDAGARRVVVSDFHRTGYNLLPEHIDARAEVIQGYRPGPVPGIGDPRGATGLLMVGMHGPSGSEGFLAHTLTSRIARLEVNGCLLSEAELFASSLSAFGIRPLFISGCPVACRHAAERMPGLVTCPIDRSAGSDRFDRGAWRATLARDAAASFGGEKTGLYTPRGPFLARVVMRDGEGTARKLAVRWGLDHENDTIVIREESIDALYHDLIRLCYLTPVAERVLPVALGAFNVLGRAGLRWARRHLAARGVLFNN